MFEKHLPVSMQIKGCLSEGIFHKESNISAPPSNSKIIRDNSLKSNTNNSCNINSHNLSLNNIRDKQEVTSNIEKSAGNARILEKPITRLMSKTPNQSSNFHKSDSSSDTKFSSEPPQTLGDENYEGKEIKIDSFTKCIFQSQSPSSKEAKDDCIIDCSLNPSNSITEVLVGAETVPNVRTQFSDKEINEVDCINDCSLSPSNSTPKVLVGVETIPKARNQFSDKEINEIRASVLKKIFTMGIYGKRALILEQIFDSHCPTAERDVGNGGKAGDLFRLRNEKRALILGRIFASHSPTAKRNAVKDGKTGDLFTLRNEKRALILGRIFASYSPTAKRDVNGGKTGDLVQKSNSSNSVQVTKSSVTHQEEYHSVEKGSDGTISDLEDVSILEQFETLDRRNDQINKSGKSTTSKNIRVSEKFEHLVVKNFPTKSSGSDLFSAVCKKKQKKSCTEVSPSAQYDEILVESNRFRSSLDKIQNKSLLSKNLNCILESSPTRQNFNRVKRQKRIYNLEEISLYVKSKKPRVEFVEVSGITEKLYSRWKIEVEKSNNK